MSRPRGKDFGKLFQDSPKAPPKENSIEMKTALKQIVFKANESAKKQIDMMAVESGKTRQALFVEALNDFFMKHGKPPIA